MLGSLLANVLIIIFIIIIIYKSITTYKHSQHPVSLLDWKKKKHIYGRVIFETLCFFCTIVLLFLVTESLCGPCVRAENKIQQKTSLDHSLAFVFKASTQNFLKDFPRSVRKLKIVESGSFSPKCPRKVSETESNSFMASQRKLVQGFQAQPRFPEPSLAQNELNHYIENHADIG